MIYAYLRFLPKIRAVENIKVTSTNRVNAATQAMAGEVVVWLQKRGFALTGIGSLTQGPSGVGVQADFLFRRGVDSVEEAT